MKTLDGIDVELEDLELLIDNTRIVIPAKIIRASLRKYGFLSKKNSELTVSKEDLDMHYAYILLQFKEAFGAIDHDYDKFILKSEFMVFKLKRQKHDSYKVSMIDLRQDGI
jgi:hypothetical protein